MPLVCLDLLRRRFQFGRMIKDVIMREPELKGSGIDLSYKTFQTVVTPLNCSPFHRDRNSRKRSPHR